MVHDDIVWTSGAFINPAWYREYVFPNYKRLFDYLRQANKKIIYTADGDYTEFIDDIADCGVHGFVLEPLTDMKYIAEKYGRTHVFIGNADTRALYNGSKEDIYNEVRRCMEIGKSCPGFFMAVGNHIPANTPVENALYYNEIYEKMSRR
jgi:uroporphyrinogen-III decarboxylase